MSVLAIWEENIATKWHLVEWYSSNICYSSSTLFSGWVECTLLVSWTCLRWQVSLLYFELTPELYIGRLNIIFASATCGLFVALHRDEFFIHRAFVLKTVVSILFACSDKSWIRILSRESIEMLLDLLLSSIAPSSTKGFRRIIRITLERCVRF